jgi:ATP-dependent DNA helicase RecQ
MSTAREVLTNVFKFPGFRGQQSEIIENVLAGRHSMALMPTGSGKSLCFQIPSKLLGGTTVVLSPLIALMKDQVDQAKKVGFKTDYINSSLTKDERESRYKRLARGDYELVYVTPERFLKEEFREALQKIKVPLLAIDEAHCISEWGHDFRPDFTRVPEFRELLGNPTMLFLTATATPRVQQDIIKQAGLEASQVQIFFGGLSRPNLIFSVEDIYGMDSKIQHFVANIHAHPGPAIVYFALISTLEKFAKEISRLSFSPAVYHGSMSAQARRGNQKRFLEGECDLMLATPAFGLGINKPDIRLLMHAEIPGSIEAYFQEAGRAGRDDKPSHCVLLYDQDDVRIQEEFVKWAHPEPEFISNVFSLIEKNPLRLKQEGLDFLREQMNFYNRRDFRVETSVNLLKRWGFLSEDPDGQLKIERPFKESTGGDPHDGDLFDNAKNLQRIRSDSSRLFEIVNYATTDVCRVQKIHEYFGDPVQSPCGLCDVCKRSVHP